jgi:putative ABC transport system substrate-binding protein
MHTLFRHIQTRALNFFFAAAALATFAVSCPLPADAFNVIVVKNADYRPYSEVLRGFRDACNCDVREVKLQDEKEVEDLQKSSDAVVAIGTSVFKKVKAIKNLPVIYTMVMPSETGSALPPNISGVSMDISPGTYIATMKEVFPLAKKIGLLYDPKYTAAFVGEAAKAASAAGVELIAKEVHDPSEIVALLDRMHDRIDIFWMLPDPTVVTAETIDYLLRFSFQNNVPVFSFSKKYVDMGAVAALDVDPYDMGVQAGQIVNELVSGRRGAIRAYARTSRLAINAKVAKKMGLRIRDEMIDR